MLLRNLSIFFVLSCFFTSNLRAEIIDIEKIEKPFGEWRLLCENDVMLGNISCKIAQNFYRQTAVITYNLDGKIEDELLIIIPNARPTAFVQIKIDKNDLIFSDVIKESDFGLIELKKIQKEQLIKQMRKGQSLFLRFDDRNVAKEVTVKLNLKDFNEAFSYYLNNIKNTK